MHWLLGLTAGMGSADVAGSKDEDEMDDDLKEAIRQSLLTSSETMVEQQVSSLKILVRRAQFQEFSRQQSWQNPAVDRLHPTGAGKHLEPYK